MVTSVDSGVKGVFLMKKGMLFVIGLALVLSSIAYANEQVKSYRLPITGMSATSVDNCKKVQTDKSKEIIFNSTIVCWNIADSAYYDAWIKDNITLIIKGEIFRGGTLSSKGDLYWSGNNIYQDSLTNFQSSLYSDEGSAFIGRIEIQLDDSLGSESSYGVISVEGIIMDNNEQRISALESWKQTISSTIDVIQTQLASLKQWLSYWSYQNDSICSAIDNECINTSCTDTCNKGTKGCMDSNTKWSCQMQNDGCYDKIGVNCGLGANCENGECIAPVTEEKVIFRTNVMDGNYYGCTLISNCWIAIDMNGDGSLEAMGFDGKSTSCHSGTVKMNTPEGYLVIDYGLSTKIAICDSNHKEARFSTARTSSGKELSLDPTEPYKDNNQEVYSTSSTNSTIPDGANPSVNISIGLVPGKI